ncbi:MAG: hypothetical protein HGB08_04640 [Candidatus Moranbacteria bacterium]|nr:hypothetical protein [Candidatus Moranbacteria bacterium]
MDYVLSSITDIVFSAGWFFDQLLSSFTFSLIKFILGIYAIVLLVDIVLMLIQRGVVNDFRETLYGMNIPDEFIKKDSQFKKKWDGIKARISSGNESEYKVAIIEADNIIDDIITRMGYKGENLGEKLDGINPGQIENIEQLKEAHGMRNRIIHDESLSVSKDETEEIIGHFEEFLAYHQAI